MEYFLNIDQQTNTRITMRAYRSILLMAIALLAASCTKEYVTKEYITEETIIQGADMSMFDFNVKSSNWQARDGGYFEAILELPEIDQKVVNEGTVQVYRRYTDNGETVWTPLPAMRVSMEVVDGSDFYYTTFTDYEWSLGKVNVFVTTTDLYTGYNPGDMALRVVILM